MPKAVPTPKVAIVYDRVNTPYGGAENVLQSLHHLYPEAPLFTSVYDTDKAVWAKQMNVKTSFLQSFPGAISHHREYVGLMPLAFESLNLSEYDLIISVTSAEANGVLTQPNQLHICYLLTPTRYLWSHADDYTQNELIEVIKRPIFAYLKWWDVAAAKRPDFYIPISKVVAERCHKYYHQPTEAVIYPPVELGQMEHESQHQLPQILKDAGIEAHDYYLVVARLVGYKRIDLAVSASAQLGKNLVIIGDGPELSRLKELASSQASQAKIIFQQAVQSTEIAAYYKNCLGFLAPGEEDFGIAALEAHLFGKPAVLHHRSGAAEISPDGVSSTHIVDQSINAVKSAMEVTEQRSWKASLIRKQVEQYRTSQFEKQFSESVAKLWSSFYQCMESA